MKIILSRKGFDDKYGGSPSIIWPNTNEMISFPIPVYPPERGIRATELKFREKSIYQIFNELGINKYTVEQEYHYDPQIQCLSGDNNIGLFGQAGIALNHINGNEIAKGDIFLFFGSFRKTHFLDGKLNYDFMHAFHAIWGFLVVDRIIEIKDDISSKDLQIVNNHPHYKNRLSSTTENSIIIGERFGSFRYSEILKLTKTGYKKSFWSLPKEFFGMQISYHRVADQSFVENRCEFRSASIGQEFIINDQDNRLCNWINAIIGENFS